jgi:hypothetical protein
MQLEKEEVFKLQSTAVQQEEKRNPKPPYVDSPFVSHPSYSLNTLSPSEGG